MEFRETSHRPYPLPGSPWFMKQEWKSLFFLHWPIPRDIVRSQIPAGLELDLYEGEAWVSITPFQVKRMRMHGVPPLPFLHSYLELNVRTYVRHKGVPGIYLWSLDANHLPSIAGARVLFSLPYMLSRMDFKENGGLMRYSAERLLPNKRNEAFVAEFKPFGDISEPDEGSVDHWLSERYCLFSVRKGRIYRGDIHHDKWKISPAHAAVSQNTVASMFPPSFFKEEPLVRYSPLRRVFFYPFKRMG
ncbi:YqjF family protein [Peribacillus sp. SCS-26]|uniref:YqjF family protein n=1 Tax=Paraperibacillus marinus TaxID=3115295 RepID=UPI003905FF3A